MPPHDPPKLDYPFQQICADYMTLNGIQYLVVVDRLTGWPKHDDAGAKGLVKLLRDLFSTYGISEELASDGGTEFTSYEVQQLLRAYMGSRQLGTHIAIIEPSPG